ncbi:hypothetical protein K501DRAFT_299918 [Backusella circina FSU 941]|nr:hypothetical protein K501DRAFT_299918 [Backusella circina FSU 941]
MMDSDIFSKTWRSYKNRASGSENNWDTEQGLNDQYAKSSDMDEHPDREQRSHSIDHSTDSRAQREPISVLPGNDFTISNPDNKYNQDSALGVGSDDMVSHQQKSMDPRNKTPLNFKPPPPSTRKSISEDSGIGFFGDCNTVSYTPRSRTSLDQASLHRGFISTLPSAQGGRRKKNPAIKDGAPLTDITNIANNQRDESVSTSAYDNVPIGSSALESKDMKLSTRSSSDDYNNFLVDRNDMSKRDSHYRSTTENRLDLSSNSFDSELDNTNIPYSARESSSNFPSNRTEYAMKPKEKLDISTGESSHDQDSLGQYAVNTHETTDVSPGVSDISPKDKRTGQLKESQADDSATEDEDESGGKGFFSFATSAAAAVGAGAAAAGAVVSNALFGKSVNDNAIETSKTTTVNRHFSLDDSPSVWKSEDLPSDHSNLYETPIRWGQSSTGGKAPLSSDMNFAEKQSTPNDDQKNAFGDRQIGDLPSSSSNFKSKEEGIPHRAYVVPSHSNINSQVDSRLSNLPLQSNDKQTPYQSSELPTHEKVIPKDTTFSSQIPVSELATEGSATCVVNNMPRSEEPIMENGNLKNPEPLRLNEHNHVPYHAFDVPTREQALLKDAILTPPLAPSEPVENEHVPYNAFDVPTREQALLKDAILTPPLAPAKLAEDENVPYQPHDVPTREQAMIKDAILTPPPSESTKPELVEDSPYNVPTKSQAILEKSISGTPPSRELKNVSGMLPNQRLYTSMPLPNPLKLDQAKPISQPERLESIEGDTREKSVPLMRDTVLSDRMPGSFEHSAYEETFTDNVSGIEHLNDKDEPAIHGQHACFHTMDVVPPEITPKQVTHSFCGDVKEPSLHGQNPSFYPDEGSSVTNDISNKNLKNGQNNLGSLETPRENKSPTSALSGNLNQDQSPVDGFVPIKGITRELKRENPVSTNQELNQGINHDGVTYRDFASQGAYDPAISQTNSNDLRNKGKQVADVTAVEHDIYGNPLRSYEQSQVPTGSSGLDDKSQEINPESSKDNGYVLGGQTPNNSKSPNYQSGYPSAKSAAGAAAAVGASIGASKLFGREKKNQVTSTASDSYNIDSNTQNLEPISPAPLNKINKQNELLGFNKLEKESNESVSSTRATTGKIVPDAVYIKRNEDEVKPRATYNEELPNPVSTLPTTYPAVVEEDAIHPTSAPISNAAKLPPANKDYPARVDQNVSANSRPADNVRRKSKGSIVMDKLRRLSLGGRKSSGSSNDIVVQDVERRPSAAEIYKNQQLKAQSEKVNTKPSLDVNSAKNQTEIASPLAVTTEGYTSGQTTKPINIANEVPYYVEDPRLSSTGPQPQIDSNQKISRIPGVNNMYPSGTKPLKPGKTVFVRLDDNHTTPQLRQVVISQAEPLDRVTNVEQGASRNVNNTTTTSTGMNDNVSFGTYISGQLENRRGSIQKTVGKLVKNEDMQEKGDLKKVSGKIKIKAYQENRRSSSVSQ